ncbi:MAG: alpha/beta fold hydrolase [Chloroflexi bacterium]|nr:alpha/beta fold hydrolase [Chloroflexota bacterium]
MAFTPAEPRTVQTTQGLVSYRYAASHPSGSQTPVVLLHGLGGSSIVWTRNMEALAQSRPVFAPDLWSPQGTGRSNRTTPAEGVRFLSAFMDAVGLEAAHVAGNSLGGLIAGHFAIAHPSRVRSLTFVGSAGLGREIAWSQRLLTLPGVGEFFFRPTERRVRSMLKLLIKNDDIPEDLVQALYEASLQPGVTKQMLAALRAGVSLRGVKGSVMFLEGLAKIEIPSLVTAGERDPLFPASHPERAVATLPHAELHVFAGAGHWPHFEDSSAFNQVVLDFLNTVEANTAA